MRGVWLLVVAGLGAGGLGAQPTWREAGPILDRYCNACHRAGQVGPFDFTTYEAAAAYGPEMVRYVGAGKMPPWAATGSVRFANTKALPAAARETLLQWARSGAKAGVGAGPTMRVRNPQWNLGAPDLILSQPKEHTVAGEKTVEIVTVRFSAAEVGTESGDRMVEGFELRPSNRDMLHHALLRSGGRVLAAWAMLDGGLRLPAGAAWRLERGAGLEVELHYFKRSLRPARDLTRVALYWAKGKPVEWAEVVEVQKEELRIPAGAERHRETAELRMESGGRVWAVLPGFQMLARQVDVRLGGVSFTVKPYEHHLMTSYVLERPVAMAAGQSVEVAAVFNNSRSNPENPHKELREVRTGENGLDETFRVWVTVLRKADSR